MLEQFFKSVFEQDEAAVVICDLNHTIVYYSQHHGNTKKLIDAIAEKHEVTLIDVTKD